MDENIVRFFDVQSEIREEIRDRDGRAAVRFARTLRHKRREDKRRFLRSASSTQETSSASVSSGDGGAASISVPVSAVSSVSAAEMEHIQSCPKTKFAFVSTR